MPGPDGDAGFGAVWNRLVSLPHWDIADLEVLPSHTANSVKAAADRDGYDILADEKSSVIVPFDTCRENPLKWLSGMSSHSRHELRRHRRKLEGAVDDKPITLVRTDASDLALMNAFYRIEASGWKGEQGTGTAIACAENTKSFYDEIAERFTRRGLFELYALTVGGEPIAMLYAIRAHQRMSLLKIGYLNKYESSAPGQLMFDEVFHVLWDRGISEGDFGPDGDYKRRWTQNLVPRVSCRIFNSNFYGKALHALETQVKPAVKAIFAASSEQA
jgi:CelD/BcsL family acetyltransferase involved in cellulose biosynthesis